MITCHRSHLEARCRERGYKIKDVMPCVVAQDGDTWTVDETHAAYPRHRPGLGDAVGAVLGAIGITEERVSKALGRPCGCKGRKARLNAIGRRFGL